MRHFKKKPDIPLGWDRDIYVSKQLGHSNPTTTLRYYAKWLPDQGESYVDVLDIPIHGTGNRMTKWPESGSK